MKNPLNPPFPRDRRHHQLHKGDRISYVHDGEPHTAQVESSHEHDDHPHHWHVKTSAGHTVPAHQTHRLHDDTPTRTAAEKKKPATTTTHRPRSRK